MKELISNSQQATNQNEMLVETEIRFHRETPGFFERIPMSMYVRDGLDYCFTEYRGIGEVAITKSVALELQSRLTSINFSILRDPLPYIDAYESKSEFFDRYFRFDDKSCRTSKLLLAIAEAELLFMVKEAISRIQNQEYLTFTTEESKALYAAGLTVGLEQVRVPAESSFQRDIEKLKSFKNFDFNEGYKNGLFNAPFPNFRLNANDVNRLAKQLMSESISEFQKRIFEKNVEYFFPMASEDLGKGIEGLHQLMNEHLPLAKDLCDGTHYNSQINEDYGSDVCEQIRDELIRRHYEFSIEEMDKLDFLKWPLNEEQADFTASTQLADTELQIWNNKIKQFAYGSINPVEAERERLISIFEATVKNQVSNSYYKPSLLSLRISSSCSSDAPPETTVFKDVTRRIEELSEEGSFILKISDFNFYQDRRVSFEDPDFVLNENHHWMITLKPSNDPKIWPALQEFQRLTKQSIEVFDGNHFISVSSFDHMAIHYNWGNVRSLID